MLPNVTFTIKAAATQIDQNNASVIKLILQNKIHKCENNANSLISPTLLIQVSEGFSVTAYTLNIVFSKIQTVHYLLQIILYSQYELTVGSCVII